MEAQKHKYGVSMKLSKYPHQFPRLKLLNSREDNMNTITPNNKNNVWILLTNYDYL